jgi:hypothetical protein
VSCDSYELHEDETADIYRAGFDTYYVESLPAGCELTILVRLWLEEGETGELELQLLGPGTTPLGSKTFRVEADPGTNHRPGYLVSQIEALNVGFLAETEGIYSAEIETAAEKRRDPTSPKRRRSIFLNVREGLPE